MLLLRHASAGERLSSPSLDRARPLDREGRADARRLQETLAAHAIDAIFTSPHRRCVDTVRPLARARQLEIQCCEELAPDAPRRAILALLNGLAPNALVCTHREVLEQLFRNEVTCEKGGTWLVERAGRGWSPQAYLASPTRVKRTRRRAAVV
jgi:8-oxo-(d)GTP phosphatase